MVGVSKWYGGSAVCVGHGVMELGLDLRSPFPWYRELPDPCSAQGAIVVR